MTAERTSPPDLTRPDRRKDQMIGTRDSGFAAWKADGDRVRVFASYLELDRIPMPVSSRPEAET